MKKLLLTLVCVLTSFSVAFSQNVFKEGDKVVNIGIGLGSTLHTGTGYSMKVPPISGSFEYCVKDNLFDDKSSLGIGALVGYASSQYKVVGYKAATLSDLVLGVRGALHYQFVDKLDTYAGITLGYDIVSLSGKNSAYDISSSAFFAGGYLGARYYFADNIAVMGELGYDIAVLSLGVAFKF